ncbi:MAG TPA: 16S rRNA (guanine(527)-N(7))-methyltransferase RsmG [Pusillimonas sp.]|jgi:16S rRNA (guanine527-N7)-methyltransferase|nr:16S rRNA (guanine(527)-N(7))-methyltransferase RsmG [Pusillimonas sp.]MBC43203.1 16S rRNA (guanine(527)-N(7))-methyltransferase RsmG [Pusillimonas sp.]HBT33556.1 16S rRNA (guanine(527)-N(7))-methyltransferase RsmG [Pusillimonas sp.]|tara:strand:- start:3296 stop:3961 length:666 start_codon:yes stop_codon:yes gene_type:complete
MDASADFKSRIEQAAQKLGLGLSELQIDQLQKYVHSLLKWNRTYNLTALREPDQILVHHIFDSLALIPFISKYLDTERNNMPGTMIDVGSGGGLPGVVLAICFPDWQVHCVDAVEKKTAFIRQLRGILKLENLQACHGRIEELDSFKADIIVSRAFASLRDFVTLSSAHLKPDGIFIAMKGLVPEKEIQDLALHTTWKVWHIDTLGVPDLNAQRCLVWIRG